METETLTPEEQSQLLALARNAIEQAVCEGRFQPPDFSQLSLKLREDGVCFVTLTLPGGQLRGCIGGLEARRALAVDVCEHAVAAALEDYRFQPVRPDELSLLRIEISRLTRPRLLEYSQPEELPSLLRPGIDGVILRDGFRRATFLPQVWEKLPDPCEFLSQLCYKMGVNEEHWRRKKLKVEVYQVEKFHERLLSV